MTHPAEGSAPSHAWRNFNHETRLALHTLLGSLQLAKQQANTAQLDHLRTAERCSAVILQLLETYAIDAPNTSLQQAAQAATAELQIPDSSAPSAAALVLPVIPTSEIAKFRQLVENGQLLSVEEWIADLVEVYGEVADVGDAIGYYASAADLPSLRVVLERWQKIVGMAAT